MRAASCSERSSRRYAASSGNFWPRARERLAPWRRRLSEALGSNGSVLAEVVPDISLILGELPPAPSLGAAEAQNRFRLVFQNLFGALAQKKHPLVVFLDDLQWADAATLGLLQTLLASSSIRHLFLIGAYRDNEVSEAHPLMLATRALEANGTRLHRILLGSLGPGDVALLIQDTPHAQPSVVAPLARLIMQKTDGNPFFMRQFLEALLPVAHFDRSALMLYEPDQDILRVCALEGRFHSERFRIGAVVDRKDSHAGWVFDRAQPLLRRDLAQDRQYTPEQLVFAEGIRSLCTVPVIFRGRTIGTLSVLSEKANQYCEGDVEILQDPCLRRRLPM